jgi:hypothetical protein
VHRAALLQLLTKCSAISNLIISKMNQSSS